MTLTVEFRGDRNGVAFGNTVEWEFALNVGRRTWSETTQPATLELGVVWSSDSLGPVSLSTWQLGDKITLEFRVVAVGYNTWYKLFYGSVTDVSVDQDRIRVTAVSLLIGSLGRTWIDTAAATDVSLQTVITAAMTAATTAGALPGGTVTYNGLTQSDVTTTAQTNVNALQLVNTLLESEPTGCLAEQFGTAATPQLSINGYDARRITTMPSTSKYVLTAYDAAIFDEWRAEQHIADLVNKATVVYNGGTAVFADTVSVAAIGTYGLALSTVINESTDADYLARRYVLRNNEPRWRIEPLTVNMRELSAFLCNNIGRYCHTGAWVSIPSLFTGAQTDFFIEGFFDVIRYSTAPGATTQWFRTLYITDINATDAAQRWTDVVSGVTWATVNPAYTWLTLEETDI